MIGSKFSDKDRWISLFYSLLKEGKQTEALSLKNNNLPKSLYRYRPLNNGFDLSNIKDNLFFLSEPGNMNDPYESDFLLDSELMKKETYKNGDIFKVVDFKNYLSEEEILKLRTSHDPNQELLKLLMAKYPEEKSKLPIVSSVIKSVSDKMSNEMHQWFDEFIKAGIRFCSFSTRNDSILMWAHYGNKHSGICVEYDFTYYHLKNRLYPIIYADTMMDITDLVMKKELNYLIPIFAVSQKSVDWSYESEWRLAITHGMSNGNLVNSPKPVRIFLGAKISDEHKNEVKEVGLSLNIQVVQMEKVLDSFKILPV